MPMLEPPCYSIFCVYVRTRGALSIDKEQLWTRTACEGGFLLAFGSSAYGFDAPCAEAGDDTHKVRCCADTVGTGGGDDSGGALTVSVSSCDDLGWTNANKFGSSLVCGESDDGLGGCSGEVDWASAVAFCEGSGARLCSSDELAADEARSTGCS